jgi:hypothetical protein
MNTKEEVISSGRKERITSREEKKREIEVPVANGLLKTTKTNV